MPVVDGALVHEATSPIDHGHASAVHDDEAYARSIAMMEQGVHNQSSDTTTWFESMVANGGGGSGNDTEMQIIHDEEMARSLSFAEAGTSFAPPAASLKSADDCAARHGETPDEALARRLQSQYDHDDAARAHELVPATTSAGRGAGSGLDFGLAMMLQQLEISQAAAQGAEGAFEEREIVQYFDPVWGELKVPEGTKPRRYPEPLQVDRRPLLIQNPGLLLSLLASFLNRPSPFQGHCRSYAFRVARAVLERCV